MICFGTEGRICKGVNRGCTWHGIHIQVVLPSLGILLAGQPKGAKGAAESGGTNPCGQHGSDPGSQEDWTQHLQGPNLSEL